MARGLFQRLRLGGVSNISAGNHGTFNKAFAGNNDKGSTSSGSSKLVVDTWPKKYTQIGGENEVTIKYGDLIPGWLIDQVVRGGKKAKEVFPWL